MRISLWSGLVLCIASTMSLLYTYWVPIREAYSTVYVQGDCVREPRLLLKVSFPKRPSFWQAGTPVHLGLFNIRSCTRLLIAAGADTGIGVTVVDGTNPNSTALQHTISKSGSDFVFSVDPSHLSGEKWISISNFIAAERMSPDTYIAFFAVEPAGTPLSVEARSSGAYEVRGGEQQNQDSNVNLSRISARFTHLEAIANAFSIVVSVLLGVGISLVVESLRRPIAS